MIKDVLQSITSVEIYPTIAMILFIICFAAITLKAVLMDKTELARISRLPLDDSEKNDPATENYQSGGE